MWIKNKIIILSGDVDITVSQIAKTLEIEEYYSELTPLDKVKNNCIIMKKSLKGIAVFSEFQFRSARKMVKTLEYEPSPR